ncbi:HAD family hydrolase [Marinobacterium rhizophilum]|uniref:phosphoglycolate phosphatase n=1 Tax=Marinobacterium rhizophilum TaxID=420402 RepID=A0ABY5HD69_9GAMM|nr:HAD hydrolase-like protein [Marinobacterium rhizophilum]UTW10272.1 HAD family hydrolase [Marinobacterium rhizophilum]
MAAMEMNDSVTVRAIPVPAELQAVFFDFDDALAQSLDIKAEAFMSLFADRDALLQRQILDFFLHHTGRARSTKLRHVYAEFLNEPLSDAALTSLCQQFAERSMAAVIASPEVTGADSLLRVLKARDVPLFVVSGTPETELVQVIRARGMAGYFAGVRGTPVDKEVNIAELLDAHQLDASRCLMVGDGRVDCIAAEHNGMPFVGVVKGANPFAEGIPVVADLAELQQLLLGNSQPD